MTARRIVLTGLAALALAGAAQAADRIAVVPLKKVFPYLDAYLAAPVADRSRFAMAYRLQVDGKPNPAVRLAFVNGAERVAVPVDASGRIGRLPSLAMLKSDQKAEITGPEGHKIGLVVDVEATMAPALELDARALSASAAQATAGATRAAGKMSFAAPRLERVVFQGAAGGQVVSAQGRSQPLPVVKGEPVFDPARYADARSVRFTRAPRRILLDKAG
jgi:hypothetical protein